MSSRASLKRANTNDGSVSPPPPKRAVKQASTTTKQAVHNFFKPASQKDKNEKLSWRITGSTLVVGRYLESEAKERRQSLTGKKKIAAFDFDSTLITTASKAKFARDANDWCWWHGSVPAKLKSLYDEGYILVIISNQKGISLRPAKNAPKVVKDSKFTQFKQKATAVFNGLNLPLSLYAATERDQFRKPATGIWKELLSDQETSAEDVDLENSIFVGDAGGRTAGTWNGKAVIKDFSCSDRNFASNIGIKYTTPEEFFLGEPPRPFERLFEPSGYTVGADTAAFVGATAQEIVLFVGFPGSGKSTFFRKILQPLGYERVNQDALKSKDRCIKAATEYLKEGKSVAVDNTNPDRQVRESWISLAQRHAITISCLHFTASKELARHNDSVRGLSGQQRLNPDTREILPQLAFNFYSSRFQEPKVEEGFSEVLSVDFQFDGSEEDRKIWGKYWY